MTKFYQKVIHGRRMCIVVPLELYLLFAKKAPTEGYTKREMENDHHVKDYMISILKIYKNVKGARNRE